MIAWLNSFNWKYFNRRLKKSLFSRVSSVTLLIIAFMGFLSLIPQTSKWMASKIFDGSIILLSWVEKPLQSFDELKNSVAEVLYIRQHLPLLKDTFEQVRILKNQKTLLEYENKKLYELLNIPQFKQINLLTIPCTGSKVMSYRQVIFARVGTSKGVKEKQPAFLNDQLVGQVDRVTQNTSRILLISDESSRVPVCFSQSKAEGILTGDGKGNLIIPYRNSHEHIEIGEKVFTSGVGGVFPTHKYVGQVSQIKGDLLYVQPSINFQKMTYIQIMLNHNLDEFAELSDENK